MGTINTIRFSEFNASLNRNAGGELITETIAPDEGTLYTASESALFEDGAIASKTNGSRSRILQYHLYIAQEDVG
jgi:hypothetical protein